MEPFSATGISLLALIDWKKVAQSLATDAAKSGAKGLLGRFKQDTREKAAKDVVGFFVEEFLREIEDKTPLTSAIPGYHDQLKRLVEHAAPDITVWLQPETREVDLGSVERIWNGIGLDPLPEGFDWPLVAKSFARDIRAYVKSDENLRERLNTSLHEESAESLSRLAGPDPGFDLTGYRDYLRMKCGMLQLSAMHTSTYERRINLWSVFVAQSARLSTPVRDLPRDIRRKLREEKHLLREHDEGELAWLREAYQSTPVIPVLDVFARERLLVVLGDPGAGKTSLLKFLVMRWVNTGVSLVPLWIDLKQYAEERIGILKYLESGCTTYKFDARTLDQSLRNGEVALYLDGLDEVFDGPTRGGVVEEIAAFAARYPQAPIVVTSRIIGYDADRLRNSGFTHATLEEFDNDQVREFVAKWHDAAEDDPKERARLQRQLESALQESRAVRELAGNPLLLTMTAILNRTQPLPRNRVELYEQASRVLLYEWDASRSLPVDTFARQEKEELLRELAGAMQAGEGGLAGNIIDRASLLAIFRKFLNGLGVPDAHGKAEAVVNQLTGRNFILSYAGANRFSFVHRTFLEYFCAAWFVELFEKKRTLTLEELKAGIFGQHWHDETWHEVLRLIAGMVGEKVSGELILLLMEQDGRHQKLANLMLAAGCLSEVRNRRALQNIDDALKLALIERVVRYDPPFFYQPYEEYSETGPTRERAVTLLASVWRGETTKLWLGFAAERDADWIVRRAAVQELARGWKEDPETLPLVKERVRSDEHYAVRRAAVQELARGWKEDPETLPLVKERVRSDEHHYVRSAAVQELARGWKEDPETLPLVKERVRSDEHHYVRIAAVQELARGWKEDPETLSFLKDRVRSDERYAVRIAAVQELARGWKEDPETLSLVKDRVRSDKDSAVRIAAVQELARGWKEDPETLSLVKDRVRSDKDSAVRIAAVQELARGWKEDPETLPFLKDRVRSDEHYAVRSVAVQELARGWKEDPETLSFLKDRVRSDEHYDVRRAAVQELARGWKEDPETLYFLKDRVRSDEHDVVRIAAVQELARGWKEDPEVQEILRQST